MSLISSANIVNYDYILRNCYSANRYARKSANRTSIDKSELLSYDSGALAKIAKNLQEISYDKENGKNIYNNAKVLIETYNNTVGTADKIESAELERNMKKLKKFVKENKDAFESIGIKIGVSGKMELDKEKMLKTSAEKMQKVLSGDFAKTLEKYAKKINSISGRIIKEEAAKKRLAEQSGTVHVPSSDSAGPNSINVVV